MATIGNMNGPWAVMLRFVLASYPLLLIWGAWVTINTVKDISFRGEGERFTRHDAEEQTLLLQRVLGDRLTVIEVKLDDMVPATQLVTNAQLLDHERLGGHAVMDQRVSHIEKVVEGTAAVEAEETEILRQMQRDIHEYIEWRMRSAEN